MNTTQTQVVTDSDRYAEIVARPDTTFSPAVMNVVKNMSDRLMTTAMKTPADIKTIEGLREAQRTFQQNYQTMATSFARAMSYLSAPGVKLWPDDARPGCLSLSGSLHGMSFGIIWRENADGTGSWSFHS